MQPEVSKYLFDVVRAIERLQRFTHDRSFNDYVNDEMLRSAVERQMLVIGEAISQLARSDASVAEQIRDYRRIISFRNRVVHLYDDVDQMLVWDILSTDLVILQEDVEKLLADQ